ncbi:MAG: hypothetical protein PHO02_06570 [Candidatus Nanoarchaeia archaeon]|nr:hypothetical protein [Candidatus Nanoarchaeia archaeon]
MKDNNIRVGRPKKWDVFEDKSITKTILLLASGINNQPDLAIEGITPATWAHSKHGYKKRLLGLYPENNKQTLQLIKEIETKKGSKGNPKNTKYYEFQWETFFKEVANFLKKDLHNTQEECSNAIEKAEKKSQQLLNEAIPHSKQLEQYRKDNPKKEMWGIVSCSTKLKRMVTLKRHRYELQRLIVEFKQNQDINKATSKIDLLFDLSNDIFKHCLISLFQKYCQELIWSKSEFSNVKDEIRNLFLAICFKGDFFISGNFPIEFAEIFVYTAAAYSHYYNLKPEWLIVIKPENSRLFSEELRLYEASENERQKKEWAENRVLDRKFLKQQTKEQRAERIYKQEEEALMFKVEQEARKNKKAKNKLLQKHIYCI